MQKITADHKVYANLNRLLESRVFANGFRFAPRNIVRSILFGRNNSRLRGRGLSFEELRAYRIGDDIRTLDWKTTNRTRKPHVRVYTEERERDFLLLVDQRSKMFFGSQVQMKSVTASDIAALAIWRILSLKDRVGALCFNDNTIAKIKPQGSSRSAMQIFQSIVQMNHKLPALQLKSNANQLNSALRQAERLCAHDCTLILISDLDGWNNQSLETIKRIREHNDLIIFYVVDPLEQALPKSRQLVVSDGNLQLSVDTSSNHLAERFSESASIAFDLLQSTLSMYGVLIWQIDTVSPAHEQIGAVLSESLKSFADIRRS